MSSDDHASRRGARFFGTDSHHVKLHGFTVYISTSNLTKIEGERKHEGVIVGILNIHILCVCVLHTCIALHCTALHCIALHCITVLLDWIALDYIYAQSYMSHTCFDQVFPRCILEITRHDA